MGLAIRQPLTMADFGLRAHVPAPAARELVAVIALRTDWRVDGAPAVPGRRYEIDGAVAHQLVARGKARFG